jgi:hypothetical protein
MTIEIVILGAFLPKKNIIILLPIDFLPTFLYPSKHGKRNLCGTPSAPRDREKARRSQRLASAHIPSHGAKPPGFVVQGTLVGRLSHSVTSWPETCCSHARMHPYGRHGCCGPSAPRSINYFFDVYIGSSISLYVCMI